MDGLAVGGGQGEGEAGGEGCADDQGDEDDVEDAASHGGYSPASSACSRLSCPMWRVHARRVASCGRPSPELAASPRWRLTRSSNTVATSSADTGLCATSSAAGASALRSLPLAVVMAGGSFPVSAGVRVPVLPCSRVPVSTGARDAVST